MRFNLNFIFFLKVTFAVNFDDFTQNTCKTSPLKLHHSEIAKFTKIFQFKKNSLDRFIIEAFNIKII